MLLSQFVSRLGHLNVGYAISSYNYLIEFLLHWVGLRENEAK
jgi:hypothetical protein